MYTFISDKPNSFNYFGIENEPAQKFFWYTFNKSTGTYWKFGNEESNIKSPNDLMANIKKNRELNSETYYYLIIHKKDMVFWLGYNNDEYSYEKIKVFHEKQFDKQYILENFEYVKDEWGKTRSCFKGIAGLIIFIALFGGGMWLMAYGSVNFGFIGFLVAALITVALISGRR
jgi:hypothetical protein